MAVSATVGFIASTTYLRRAYSAIAAANCDISGVRVIAVQIQKFHRMLIDKKLFWSIPMPINVQRALAVLRTPRMLHLHTRFFLTLSEAAVSPTTGILGSGFFLLDLHGHLGRYPIQDGSKFAVRVSTCTILATVRIHPRMAFSDQLPGATPSM